MRYNDLMKQRILKVSKDDEREDVELEFELDFFARLSREELVRLVLERSRLLLEMLAQDGHPVVPGVTKRT